MNESNEIRERRSHKIPEKQKRLCHYLEFLVPFLLIIKVGRIPNKTILSQLSLANHSTQKWACNERAHQTTLKSPFLN